MVPDVISMNYGGNVEKKNRNREMDDKNYGVGKAVLLLRIFCAYLDEIRLSRVALNFPALITVVLSMSLLCQRRVYFCVCRKKKKSGKMML